MKCIFSIAFLLFVSSYAFAQATADTHQGRKGQFYVYWGWNGSAYSKSNIRFDGTDYNFELYKVKASDRQSKFDFNTYFNPAKFTIPQYNFRLGFYFKNNYSISIGTDHMKYIVNQNQEVPISGFISGTSTTYDGAYNDDNRITITEDFLQFEHTDGLNYANIDVRRIDEILAISKKIKVNLTEGLGVGLLIPRTNTTLLNKERYDEFHLSGYGANLVLGINITFFDLIFIQSEFKGGYINMPSIRTTQYKADHAKQSFFFTQQNILFGVKFKL